MKFDNDEQRKEFVITIPRKVSEELACTSNEPAKELSNGKSNQAEELSSSKKELSRGKSNQVINQATNEVTDQVTDQVTNQVIDQEKAIQEGRKLSKKDLTGKQKDILNFCSVPRSAAEIMARLTISNHYYNRSKYIQPLVEAGFLKLTIPNSPTSPNQKYVKVKKR